MSSSVDFGVLYGQKTTEDALLIYSSYQDSKASPSTGDFIVLAPKNEDGVKYLARVEAEIYDEDPIFKSQDKTLIAVQYARISERELSDRDKQKIFSYTYKVKILGTFTDEGQQFKFTTAVRKLPTVSYHARHLTRREIQFILNAENENGVSIGQLCIGEKITPNNGDILFNIDKLRDSRSMVFAKSGYGKTNFIKVLLYHMIFDLNFGKLVFDLNGEYFVRGRKTYGFGDINHQCIKDNLVIYTDRELPTEYKNNFILGGKVALDMKNNLTPEDILTLGSGFSEVMKSFLLYLSEENISNFISNIDLYCDEPERLNREFPDFFGAEKKKNPDASARKTIMAIRKRIRHLIDESGGLHLDNSKSIENIFKYLKEGKTVIIDLSLKDSLDATIISNIIVKKLFLTNKRNFTTGNVSDIINSVIFVEEAQNVLSDDFVKSNSNPFVKIAKEGRKFGLGLVAITQRPSAISEEIRTQAENFFAFHMGNSDDIRALVKSNINYDGVISKFIQNETIKGNLYMVSSEQSFALPIRVQEFEKLVDEKIYPSLKF